MSNLLALDSPISLEDIHSLEPSTYRSLSNFNNTQIAVTGANGFLASNIIFYLLTLSTKLSLNLQINALCRSRSRLTSRFSSTQSISNSSGNSPLLFSKYTPYDFNDISPSQVVIHAASNASPSSYSSDPSSTCLINTLGTIKAIEYAKKSNASCFVYFSTSGVYGFNHPHYSSYKENQFGFIDCANSDNIYIESKRIGECITSSLCKEYDIPFAILRPSINYGPGLRSFR